MFLFSVAFLDTDRYHAFIDDSYCNLPRKRKWMICYSDHSRKLS